MRVTVRVFGSLQNALGGRRLAVELPPGATLRDLLETLAAGPLVGQGGALWDACVGRFRLPVIVMSGQRDIDDYSLPLHEGQEILLVAPIAGGAGTDISD